MGKSKAEELRDALALRAADWHGELVSNLSFSTGIGYLSEHPGIPVEKLIGIADDAMYCAKQSYYEGADLPVR